MIKIERGNVLEAKAQALVNTVNCVGFMGKGIALQFKKAYPENFVAYQRACRDHEVRPGRMFIYDCNSLLGVKYIINFPTKRHWKSKSRYEDIAAGLSALVADVHRLGIRSIAIPPLGCGLGGLECFWATGHSNALRTTFSGTLHRARRDWNSGHDPSLPRGRAA